MRTTLSGLLVCVVIAGPCFAQDLPKAKQVTIDDLSAPHSPAFTLLDVTPSSVDRPDNPKTFAVNLINKIASGHGLPENYALQVAPYWLASHSALTFEQHQRPSIGQSLKQSFLVSLATVPMPGETSSSDPIGTRLGLGFRTYIKNGRPNPALEAKVAKLADANGKILDRWNELVKLGTPPDEQIKILDQHKDEFAKLEATAQKAALDVQALDAERVGFFFAAAGGQTWAFTGDDVSNGKAEKFGFWLTPSYRYKGCDENGQSCKVSSVDFIAVARVLTENDKNKWDAGTRLVLRANKEFYLSFEALGRKDDSQPSTSQSKNFRSVAMIEYRIDTNIILYGSFGRDFKKDNGVPPLVSLFGLNWGFGNKPVLTADKKPDAKK